MDSTSDSVSLMRQPAKVPKYMNSENRLHGDAGTFKGGLQQG
jgi:hypothetical protein